MFGPIFWGPCLKMFFFGQKSTLKTLIIIVHVYTPKNLFLSARKVTYIIHIPVCNKKK